MLIKILKDLEKLETNFNRLATEQNIQREKSAQTRWKMVDFIVA